MLSRQARYPRWRALGVGVFVGALLGSSCSQGGGATKQPPQEQAPAKASVDADTLTRELHTLEAEMKRLRDGEGAPQAYLDAIAIQKEVGELRSKQQKALEGPQKHLYELWQHNDVREGLGVLLFAFSVFEMGLDL